MIDGHTVYLVTWEDLRKQALQCPHLAAMFELQRQGVWQNTEDALLWVALVLSEARIRALNEHAQTLSRQPFPVYPAVEWQCRHVDPDTKLCCVRELNHEGLTNLQEKHD